MNKTYEFRAPLEKRSMGKNKRGELFHTVVYVPHDILKQLPLREYPRLRIVGLVNEAEFEGALQPAGSERYLLISKRFLKEIDAVVGDEISVCFEIGDQEFVDVPVELAELLTENSSARDVWESLSVGKKRGYAALVNQVKSKDARFRRAEKAVDLMLDGLSYNGKPLK